MALKIFISSVFRELQHERLALQEEIHKLQELFVGMEFFGSVPSMPADYCVQKVEESDLYVGIFGNDYGSVDETSGMSFTQLEYEAAAAKQIPCLIYFKSNPSLTSGTDPRLSELKTRLGLRHVVHPFSDISDLKLRFLVDFINLLRNELFDKTIPVKRGPIPADALLSLTQGFIGEQIKAVGQDKYISDVYVLREAEKEIARFTQFDDFFRARVDSILQHLNSSLQLYPLGDKASLAVSRARIALADVHRESPRLVLDDLKRAFHFAEVEEAVEAINSLLTEPSNDRFEARLRAMQVNLRDQPFVNRSFLANVHDEIFNQRRRALIQKALQTDQEYPQILRLFPSHYADAKVYFANDLIKELVRLVELGLKRCLALVDRAGTGKTNVTCHVAEELVREHPVVLLSGQMELSNEYQIESYVQQRFELAFSGIFTDWMNRVSPSLQAAGKWLFIIIDGINENSKRPLFIQLLKGLLPRLEQKRIKLILSCRDLGWDVFRDALQPYLFDSAIPLHEFSEAEWSRAVESYFKLFKVECTLDLEAQEALRNPLLLRFFCESHKGQKLGRVSNLRLLSVFDLYVDRVGKSIAERHASLKPDSVLNLLLSVADQMWLQRSVTIKPASAGLDSEESSAVYNLVLSENVMLEQTSHGYSTRKSVRFLYDEFMEYIIARTWVDAIADAQDPEAATNQLLQDAFESLSGFPSALGAVLFLDKMLERRGAIVSDFIKRASKMDASFLNSQQTSLVYAFESINYADADDNLIATVAKFEPTVREDLRDRMATVILRILEAHPNHQYARKYVHQVLEVAEKPAPAMLGTRALDPPKFSPRFNFSGFPIVEKYQEDKNKKAATGEFPRLPPGRYHYSEDTKINAIGILVQKKDNRDYGVIEEGIRRLGRTDLHSALQALEFLDLASEELVYKTVAEYLTMGQPEYRIYCAWLLRERYGREPAGFMARLLVDSETRVHQYTAGVFERRLIERELLEETLKQVSRPAELRSWHLDHFIKLLGMRESFYAEDLAEVYGAQIVQTLENLMMHPKALIRLKVYRAITRYPSFINLNAVRERMRRDQDVYIRLFAEKHEQSV